MPQLERRASRAPGTLAFRLARGTAQQPEAAIGTVGGPGSLRAGHGVGSLAPVAGTLRPSQEAAGRSTAGGAAGGLPPYLQAGPGWEPARTLPKAGKPWMGPGGRPKKEDDREFPELEATPRDTDHPAAWVVDAHAHIVAHTFADTEAAMAGLASYDDGSGIVPSAVYKRIVWLEGFADAGVMKMVVSAWSGNIYDTGYVNSTAELNALACYLATKSDFFLPFAAPSYADMTDAGADPAAALEALTALGMSFAGIGEIFAHGHMYSITDNTPLYDLCVLAASWGVPICFHWNIGVVEVADDTAGVSAEANFLQLWALLEQLEADLTEPPRVILAHCGVGAWSATLLPPDGDLTNWTEWVTRLLTRFTFFYVDTAGMQTEQNKQLFEGKSLHAPGQAVAGWLGDVRLRSRVLLGTDAQKSTDAADWLASLVSYQEFLGRASAEADAKVKYDYKNAARIILSEK